MARILVVFVLVLCLVSCYNVNERNVVVPEKLLTKSEMVSVLTDVQLIEAGLSINENKRFEMKLKPEYYKLVLESHELTLKQLKENINYYQSTPRIMEDIYDEVLANLSKYQSEVLQELKDIEKRKDSVDIKETIPEKE